MSNRLAEKIVEHLKWLIKYRSGASIGVFAARQNLSVIMTAITQYVAEIEDWGPTDHTSYNSFELAKQRLYLSHSILIDVYQKALSHPDNSHVDFDVSGYSKLYYDLELSSDDPYFDTIKRDYYNDVSN